MNVSDAVESHQIEAVREEVGIRFCVPVEQIAVERLSGAPYHITIGGHHFRFRRRNVRGVVSPREVDDPHLMLVRTQRTGLRRISAARTARSPEQLLAILRQEDEAARRRVHAV